eukprot:COSAG06_NODE_1361_length_9704_cov_16.768974_5_plen_56_part_00
MSGTREEPSVQRGTSNEASPFGHGSRMIPVAASVSVGNKSTCSISKIQKQPINHL